MTDPENLILIQLRRMDEKISRLDEKFDRLAASLSDNRAELRTVKGHMATFFSAELHRDASVAEILVRLDRIERRLEIRDPVNP